MPSKQQSRGSYAADAATLHSVFLLIVRNWSETKSSRASLFICKIMMNHKGNVVGLLELIDRGRAVAREIASNLARGQGAGCAEDSVWPLLSSTHCAVRVASGLDSRSMHLSVCYYSCDRWLRLEPIATCPPPAPGPSSWSAALSSRCRWLPGGYPAYAL